MNRARWYSVLALVLVSQGVIQNFKSYDAATPVQPIKGSDGKPAMGADGEPVTEITIPMGPAASQIAIKQLGTNGGGYFGANSCHPYENPTGWSNFLTCLSIILVPIAALVMFGRMLNQMRHAAVIANDLA